MPSDIVIDCSHTLKDRKLTIAFAESVTAGKVISEFALIPNCGSVLNGSIVCYDVSVKKSLLGVTDEMIEQFTPESAEVTEQLAIGLRKLIPSDVIVAVTGLAAPGGSETEEKPVGTMFVHGFFKDKPWKLRLYIDDEPEQVILKAIDEIANYLLKELAVSA
ncbi:nicotinamide-nucleotide amidohydrolase family protein [Mucilaginibacter sp. PAMB04168]|uniref:CinA family protein n=1 Tax=Mucilaginibacter sp. PAMB04168 TaxID=3138567 RepID=UPI0031F6C6B1